MVNISPNQQTSQGVTINLQLPDWCARWLMNFVATMPGNSPQARPDVTASWEPTRRMSAPEQDTTPPGEPLVSPAAKHPAADVQSSRGPSQPEEDARHSFRSPPPLDLHTMEELLIHAPISLQRKRRKAGKGQQGSHLTSCRAFDRWARLHRSTEPVQWRLIDWLRSDCEQLEPQIRRAFALHLLTNPSNRTGSGLSPTRVRTIWLQCCMVAKAHGVELQQWTIPELEALRKSAQLQSEPSGITEERRCPTREELQSIADSCHVAEGPYLDDSPYLFAGLLQLFAWGGFRTKDVISTVSRKTGIRKQDVIRQVACPIEDINTTLGYTLENPAGLWIYVRVHKAEGKHVTELLLPLPEVLVPWLEHFINRSQDPVLIFPSAIPGRSRLSPQYLNRNWSLILSAAGVPANIRFSEGRGGVIALRKFAQSWWRYNVAQQTRDTTLARDVASYMGHHAEVTRSTSDRHYVDVRAGIMPEIIRLNPSFPVFSELKPPAPSA